jgi:archaeal flagellin FlaB
MWNKLVKDEKGFTGLEAAIVLIAFVVVAAVFSYVMLGAGFFTTQKSQEVVHTGVTQASSSVELSGDVIAHGDSGSSSTKIDTVTLFLQQTSGGTPVDINNTLITLTAPGCKPKDLAKAVGGYAQVPVAASATTFGVQAIYNDNGQSNMLIEKGEKFEITINLDDAILDASGTSIGANAEFQLEIKPPNGASYTIHRMAPPSIGEVMSLN